MAWFWKKKSEEKKVRVEKEDKDDSSVRIDAEDLLDQGYTCEEAAQELEISKEKVYRIKEARKRREERLKRPAAAASSAPVDPIQEMKQEIAKLELEQKKKEIQWKNEDLERKRKSELEEEGEEIIEEVAEAITPEDQFLKIAGPVLLQKLMAPQPSNVTYAPVQTSPSAPVVAPMPTAGQTTLESQTLMTDDEVMQNAQLIRKKIPKLMWPVIKDQLHKITDADVLRIRNKLQRLE